MSREIDTEVIDGLQDELAGARAIMELILAATDDVSEPVKISTRTLSEAAHSANKKINAAIDSVS